MRLLPSLAAALVFLLPLASAFAPLNTQSILQQSLPTTTFHNSRRQVVVSIAKSSKPDIQSVTIRDMSSDGKTSKFRRLKDFMWVREAQEDLTAAEFAISIDASPQKQKTKRAIDYDNLLNQLDRRIRDLVCGDDVSCSVDVEDAATLKLKPGKGSGSIAYTESQRNALLK
jgi:hypothetical protein